MWVVLSMGLNSVLTLSALLGKRAWEKRERNKVREGLPVMGMVT